MKNLYLIGGTMGVGKTAVCEVLNKKLGSSVFLDGDWCWYSHPFTVTDETKAVALDNICHILNNFIQCSVFENIVFCWVMHKQSIIDEIISRLDITDCRVISVSLVCSLETLTERINADVEKGIRNADVLERSLERLPMYYNLNTVKIDTSGKSINLVADELYEISKK